MMGPRASARGGSVSALSVESGVDAASDPGAGAAPHATTGATAGAPADGPAGVQDPPSIRRWRQGGQVVHLVGTIALCLWMVASVIATHAGAYEGQPAASGPRISSSTNKPEELSDCQTRLQRLLTDLHQEAFTLQARALRFRFDPSNEWANWTAAWRWRRQIVAYHCRLDEEGEQGVSPAHGLLAEVHRALGELQVSYSETVDRFVDRYLDRLRHLNDQLARARALIDASRLAHPRHVRRAFHPAEPPRDPN